MLNLSGAPFSFRYVSFQKGMRSAEAALSVLDSRLADRPYLCATEPTALPGFKPPFSLLGMEDAEHSQI
jgi:hypothetical protein